MDDNITAGELWKRREELEKAAALVLGQILFEFGRLDMGAGMCISHLEQSTSVDVLTKRAMGMSFDKRLRFLKKWIDRALVEGSREHRAYTRWIARADAARVARNELVHARWWFDGELEHAVQVTGLPNSPDQGERRYTLRELQGIHWEVIRLYRWLWNLREKWPL